MDRTVVRMVPMAEQREAYALNLSIDDRLRVLESLNAQGRRMLGVPSSARLRREVVVRTRFPKNSPPPQSHLKGVEPDRLLAEGELLEGRFRAVATPGHDDDCLTWIDTRTNTAFTGDSLQANGTICQGVGFYRSLPAYRGTLATLRAPRSALPRAAHRFGTSEGNHGRARRPVAPQRPRVNDETD